MSNTSQVPVIEDADKVAKLFAAMAKRHTKFALKPEAGGDFIVVRAVEFRPEQCIVCEKGNVEGLVGKAQGKVIVDKRPLFFDTRLYTDENENLIKVDIPDKLTKPQARASYRIDIPQKIESRATFWGEGNLIFSGRIGDISSGGCLVSLGMPFDRYEEHGPDRATTCVIEIDDNPPIELIARPVSSRKSREKDTTLVGFQFVHAGPENAALNQILAALQRTVLRNMGAR